MNSLFFKFRFETDPKHMEFIKAQCGNHYRLKITDNDIASNKYVQSVTIEMEADFMENFVNSVFCAGRNYGWKILSESEKNKLLNATDNNY